jgi:hypothetical protein
LPDVDVLKYPSKESLLKVLNEKHEEVKTMLSGSTESGLSSPVQWRFSSFMPNLKDLIIFMCISHESMHLGQLAAWRRAMGLGSALSTIEIISETGLDPI